MVQLSYQYMTTRKTIPLTIWIFVVKVMSLLFNTPSRFVIAFLPRSQHLLISRLQLLSAVILEPKNIKSVTVFTFPPSICHEVMDHRRLSQGFERLFMPPGKCSQGALGQAGSDWVMSSGRSRRLFL